jgi:hypothetical protein
LLKTLHYSRDVFLRNEHIAKFIWDSHYFRLSMKVRRY